jgi:hypothetical protein
MKNLILFFGLGLFLAAGCGNAQGQCLRCAPVRTATDVVVTKTAQTVHFTKVVTRNVVVNAHQIARHTSQRAAYQLNQAKRRCRHRGCLVH